MYAVCGISIVIVIIGILYVYDYDSIVFKLKCMYEEGILTAEEKKWRIEDIRKRYPYSN